MTQRLPMRLNRLLLAPAVLVLALGFIGPLLPVFASVLPSAEVGGPAWAQLWLVEWTTIKLAAMVAVASTVAGTVVALLVRPLPRRAKGLVYFACLFPLGVHIAFRVFGVQYLLSPEGPTAWALRVMRLSVDPSVLLFTQWATVVGLVHWTFPVAAAFMYVASSKLDMSLVDAALLLGATRVQAGRRVLLPQLYPGLVVCSTVVFCLAYGSFITPAALGGVGDVTITRLIGSLMNEGRIRDASVAGLIAVLTPLAAFVGGAVLASLSGRSLTDAVAGQDDR